MAYEPLKTIIIDTGSTTCKVGFGALYKYNDTCPIELPLDIESLGNDAPTVIFPNIVGRPTFTGVMIGMGQKSEYIGSDAWSCPASKNLKRPVTNGMINWEDMEKVWFHAYYNELRECPEESISLFTEPPMNPKLNREKMIEILFESFNVPALVIANKAVLSLYSTGRVNGTVLNSGNGMSHVVPVQEGYALTEYVSRSEISGSHLTQYTHELLEKKSHSLKEYMDRVVAGNRINWEVNEIAKLIKERICYTKDYLKTDIIKTDSIDFVLPDGVTVRIPITIDNDRFKIAEALFQPDLIKLECMGLHESIENVIKKLQGKVDFEVYSNVILSGGTNLIPGLTETMKKKISVKNIKVTSSGKNSSWIGASILSSVSTFMQMITEIKDYNEFGPSIIHKKCL